MKDLRFTSGFGSSFSTNEDMDQPKKRSAHNSNDCDEMPEKHRKHQEALKKALEKMKRRGAIDEDDDDFSAPKNLHLPRIDKLA